jgi:hypothetical protein
MSKLSAAKEVRETFFRFRGDKESVCLACNSVLASRNAKPMVEHILRCNKVHIDAKRHLLSLHPDNKDYKALFADKYPNADGAFVPHLQQKLQFQSTQQQHDRGGEPTAEQSSFSSPSPSSGCSTEIARGGDVSHSASIPSAPATPAPAPAEHRKRPAPESSFDDTDTSNAKIRRSTTDQGYFRKQHKPQSTATHPLAGLRRTIMIEHSMLSLVLCILRGCLSVSSKTRK